MPVPDKPVFDGKSLYPCYLPGYMVQLVEVQQLRGAVGGDLFCCLLTEEPPEKKDGKLDLSSTCRFFLQVSIHFLHYWVGELLAGSGASHRTLNNSSAILDDSLSSFTLNRFIFISVVSLV